MKQVEKLENFMSSSKNIDEEVARLHLEVIYCKLTVLSDKQAMTSVSVQKDRLSLIDIVIKKC